MASPRRKDLSGQKFGKWTVLRFSHVQNNSAAYWHCRCECGTEKPVRGSMLRNGTSSCCKACTHLNKAEKHLGKKYGHLTIDGIDDTKTTRWKQIYVWTTCDCGNKSSIKLSYVVKGRTTTCSKKCFYYFDLQTYVGEKIGKLIIKDVVHSAKNARHYFICNCECGVKGFKSSAHHVLSGRTQSCGCLVKERDINGGNNPNWRGGVTPELLAARASMDYQIWRKAVLDRDGGFCQYPECAVQNNLCAHHIKSFALYPELRYDIDNGITLCEYHHKEFHSRYGVKQNSDDNLKSYLLG